MDQPLDGTATVASGDSLLARHWRALALGVLLGLLAGQLFTVLATPRYTSTTAVLVLPTRTATPGTSGGAPSEINMNTESELVRSAKVARAAAAQLRTRDDATTLLQRVVVAVPSNSQVLSISYVDQTAVAAQQGAAAFAQAYLTDRADEVQTDLERQTGTSRRDLEDAQELLRLATDRAAALPDNSPDRVYAEAQRDILANQISSLNNRLTSLEASNLTAGQVITEATAPESPSFPQPWLDLAAGLVLGLLLGLALALLAERFNRRVRGAADVTHRLRLPLLAHLTRPGDLSSATFDRVRNALAGPSAQLRLVQIADVAGHGAGSRVALELARSCLRARGEATLVVAHPDSRAVEWFELTGREGLVEVLRGERQFDDVRRPIPESPGLALVPPGLDPQALELLLQSGGTRRVLSQLAGASAVIVLETLGTGSSAAAQAVAAGSETLIIVAETGCRQSELSRAVEGAAQMGATIAGVVLVSRRLTSRTRRLRPGAAHDDWPGPEPRSASGGESLLPHVDDDQRPPISASVGRRRAGRPPAP